MLIAIATMLEQISTPLWGRYKPRFASRQHEAESPGSYENLDKPLQSIRKKPSTYLKNQYILRHLTLEIKVW